MFIEMDEKTHTYFVDGQVAAISVTELLHKHGLAPSYDGVDDGLLEVARNRGKEVHADIEKYIMADGFTPETREGLNFAIWAETRMHDDVRAEQKLALDWNGLLIACTVDLLGTFYGYGRVLDDHKVTARFYREYVSWQVSLNDYIARKCSGRIINDNYFSWLGAEKLLCTLFDKDGKMAIKECDKIPDSEIERLLDAELHGEIYKRPALVIPQELGVDLESAELALVAIKEQEEAVKARVEKMRAALIAEMERQGIYSYKGDKVEFSYRAPSDRVSVDSTRLKRELPQVYEQYSKVTKVKASVTIKVKGEEE